MDQRVSLVQRLSERYIKLPSLLEFLVYVPTDTLIPVGGVHYRQFMPATRDGKTGYLVMSGTTRPLYILEADYLELTGALDSYLAATHYFGHHVGGERIAQLWLGWEKAEKAEEA